MFIRSVSKLSWSFCLWQLYSNQFQWPGYLPGLCIRKLTKRIASMVWKWQVTMNILNLNLNINYSISERDVIFSLMFGIFTLLMALIGLAGAIRDNKVILITFFISQLTGMLICSANGTWYYGVIGFLTASVAFIYALGISKKSKFNSMLLNGEYYWI